MPKYVRAILNIFDKSNRSSAISIDFSHNNG